VTYSFIAGGNRNIWRKPQKVTDKLYHIKRGEKKRNEENERFVELDVFFKTSHQKNKI
jgi:hypothetical protein